MKNARSLAGTKQIGDPIELPTLVRSYRTATSQLAKRSSFVWYESSLLYWVFGQPILKLLFFH
jgi:hypothetical protein